MSEDDRVRRLSAVVVALVFLSVGVGATSHVVSIESFDYSGDGAVATPQDHPYLWQSEPHAFEAVLAGNESRTVDVCLTVTSSGGNRSAELACQRHEIPAGDETTVTFELDRWPANQTGDRQVSLQVTDPNASDRGLLAQETMELTVLEKDGDPDEDGLPNEQELAEGTDFFSADTDGDGLNDGTEVNTYGTNPNRVDTDGDGLDDATEVNETETDPTMADTDEDGLTDEREVNDHGTNPNKADTDDDGLTDAEEVNTYGTDPTTADTDDDGLGDAAEVNDHGTNPNEADTDGDGLEDGEEVNVYETDPTSADTDGDGLEDGEEVNRYQTDPTDPDSDDDGLEDGVEVDDLGTNPNRADTDGDGLDDGDEVQGGTHPLTPDAGQAGDGQIPSREVVGGLFVVAGIVLLAIFVYARRSGRRAPLAALLGRTGPSDERANDEPHESTPAPVGDGVSFDEPPPIPTNQTRVLELLNEHGGRMLQSDIVEQTDWSKSKVSRVLSDMDEEGQITKIDVGKGNLISLPEVAPPGSRSPSDRPEE